MAWGVLKTVYVPNTTRYLNFVFFLVSSLDQARGQHFYKGQGRWSWWLFACKFSYILSSAVFLLSAINRLCTPYETLLSCSTHGGRYWISPVLSRVTIYSVSVTSQCVTKKLTLLQDLSRLCGTTSHMRSFGLLN